jgi:hypothetical protein
MADGRLLPDHISSNEEVMALADVFADYGVGHLSWTRGPSEKRGGDAFIRELAARSGRLLNLVGIAASSLAPGAYRKMLGYLEESHRRGLPMYCSAVCMDIPIAMTLAEFNMFDTMPNWVDPFVGTPAQRAAKLALPEVRAAISNAARITPSSRAGPCSTCSKPKRSRTIASTDFRWRKSRP